MMDNIHIDRRSTFTDFETNDVNSHEDNENKFLRILNEMKRIHETSFGDERTGRKFDFDDKYKIEGTNISAPKYFLINSFYLIGMIDYDIATMPRGETDPQRISLNKDRLKKLLIDRAYLSAGLQYFYNNEFDEYISMTGKGGNNRDLFWPEEENELLPEDIPDTWYHGHRTVYGGNITAEELLNGDSFFSKDGMVYVGDLGTAENYVRDNTDQIIEISAENNPSNYLELPGGSHGGVPFMFQDEIYDLSRNRKKDWLIQQRQLTKRQGRDEAIYIGNFADFVDRRDALVIENLEANDLSLPSGYESLDEYIDSIQRDRTLDSVINTTYNAVTMQDITNAENAIMDAYRHPRDHANHQKAHDDRDSSR